MLPNYIMRRYPIGYNQYNYPIMQYQRDEYVRESNMRRFLRYLPMKIVQFIKSKVYI